MAESSVAPPAQSAVRRANTPSWLLLMALGLATGCGQKGPLTLPASPAAAASAPASR